MNKILDVKIDSFTIDVALQKARDFLHSNKQNLVFTPNPEMLVDAQGDDYFKKVLNSGDMNICDGFGVSLVSGGKIKRITGIDFVLKLCELAQIENKSIYLLGSGSREVLKTTADNLKNKFPNLRLAGFSPGPRIDFLRVENEQKIFCEPFANDEAIHDIIMTAPDILLVAFGHNKQEKWIYENVKSLPSVRLAMGVGGSFDYIAGFNYKGEVTKRAPCFLRKIGLEWLYRLYKQPWRIGRIFKATAVFMSLVIYNKFKKYDR